MPTHATWHDNPHSFQHDQFYSNRMQNLLFILVTNIVNWVLRCQCHCDEMEFVIFQFGWKIACRASEDFCGFDRSKWITTALSKNTHYDEDGWCNICPSHPIHVRQSLNSKPTKRLELNCKYLISGFFRLFFNSCMLRVRSRVQEVQNKCKPHGLMNEFILLHSCGLAALVAAHSMCHTSHRHISVTDISQNNRWRCLPYNLLEFPIFWHLTIYTQKKQLQVQSFYWTIFN